MKLTINGHTYDVQVASSTVVVEGHPFQIKSQGESPKVVVYVNDRPYQVELPASLRPPYRVMVNGLPYEVSTEQAASMGAPAAPTVPGTRRVGAPAGSILAPVTGTITTIKVQPGQAVEVGALLLVLEAMKMENEIKAPKKGVVKEILVAKGSRVTEGQALAIVE